LPGSFFMLGCPHMENLQNEKIKGILLAVGAFLTIFLALKSWEIVRELSAPRLDRPSISITGEGRVFIKPDIGQISLGVVAESATVAEAQRRAADTENKIIASLKANGVEEKDIKVINYNISPKYDYGQSEIMIYPPRPGGVPRIVGYTVSENLEVKIRDTAKAGKIISDAGRAGANQVGGIVFTTEDPSTVQAEARAKAIEDANNKAKELERRLGIRLGKIIGFYESGGPYPIYRDYALGKGGDAAMPTPEIPVGENEVVVNVNITYQIR